MTMDTNAEACELALLSEALCYPRQEYRRQLSELELRWRDRSVAASEAVRAFLRDTEGSDAACLEETYTRTFDLAPQCAPYLGAHLFGEQDARRNRFMIGLAMEYEEAGVDAHAELPDHVAVVLRSLEKLPASTCRELVDKCVVPALRIMGDRLASTDNPYRHLIAAASQLTLALQTQPSREVEHD